MEIVINSPANPVFFHILSYPIRYYGIIMSLAILTGIFLSEYIVKLKHNAKTLEIFQDSIPPTIIFSIIGARLFYVLGLYNYYVQNPSEIFMINHGGISIWGAIIFGIISILIYSKIKKVSFLKYVDFYALVIPLCQAIGRFGNYFNQEAYGKPTDGIIKLFIDESHRNSEFFNIQYYHPTFLYEAILDFIIFILLFGIYRKNKILKSGTIFYLYLIFYSSVRFFIETIRIDSILNLGSLKIAQVICILCFGVSVFFLIKLYKKTK